MMNLLREYKLYKFGIWVDYGHRRLFDSIESKILNLEKEELDSMPYVVFFNDCDGNVFEYIKKSKHIHLRESKFWGNLIAMYSVSYDDIQTIIRHISKSKFNLDIESIMHIHGVWMVHK